MFTWKYKGSISFSSSVVGTLVNLRVLVIEFCYEIVKVIEDFEEEEDDEKVVLSGGEIRSVVIFPKLEELVLNYLPKLVRFCEWKCEVELPSLAKVEIRKCPNMESFSLGSVAAPNLKIVEIDEDEIDATKDLNGTLQKIFCSRILQINHNPFYGHEIPSSAYNRLEKLTISECVGSMSLFTLSMAANLVSLRKLFIEDCHEMIKVIEDELQQESILVFPKLKKLYLRNLPKLVTFCDSKCDAEFPILGKVEIKRCPNMESLSLGLVATPKLAAFSTDLTTYVAIGVDVAFNRLKELQIRENENPFDHHKISVSLFNGLKRLIFNDVKANVSLFSSSAIGSLVNLQVLGVGHSDEIVKVIRDEIVVGGGEIRTVVFPKLEELYLYNLARLVKFCEWKCDVELPSLTKVEIYKCPNMANFSMGCVAAPNFKIVEIDEEEIEATEDLNGLLQQHYLAHQQKENEEEESCKEKNEIEEEDDDD